MTIFEQLRFLVTIADVIVFIGIIFSMFSVLQTKKDKRGATLIVTMLFVMNLGFMLLLWIPILWGVVTWLICMGVVVYMGHLLDNGVFKI